MTNVCKGPSYRYIGTKGHIASIASSLPPSGEDLEEQGWENISHPAQAAHGSQTYREPSTGLKIRFDKGKPNTAGFAGKNHYHILNPNASSNANLYLDENGNPVRKSSKASHILPKGGN